MPKIQVAGFFTGTGGIELGLTQTGGFETVFANDIDPYAAQTYAANFNQDHYLIEDINNLKIETLPTFNMLVGGFPCQPFSNAGRERKGFEDTRGTVFFRLAEIIKERKPEYLLLENVKGLVGHDQGRTFPIIINTLQDLGYTVKHAVLNSAQIGNVPQGRERIYILGFLNPEHAENFTFPTPTPLTVKPSDLFQHPDEIDDKYYYTPNSKIYNNLTENITDPNKIYQYRRSYVRDNKKGLSPTLTANMGTGGNNVPIILDYLGIRKLTPRECFNLMGYPKTFTLPPQLKDSQLYKQAGNAVTPPVIRRIGEQLLSAIKETHHA